MITRIHGKLVRLEDEFCVLSAPPFEYQILVPDFTRRQLQMQMDQEVSLHTLHFIEGNSSQGSRLIPRLIGFTSEVEREFFELFCSVGGLGVKKALRGMVRPVQDIARSIEQQDVNSLKTLPGIGGKTAEKIIAELRRKMAKFALMMPTETTEDGDIVRDIADEVYQILVTLGWNESDARRMLDAAVEEKQSYRDVDELLQVVWEKNNAS
ncbi:MAG: Holliday junction DNA helicase RuvA [Planctomycetaceae bacterium]|nr:Holliday junction DNA helicase RuvA [Planctomycetaceae bacterium]MCP4464114.1 Holliday junction DNA helicase RuvA [Planctomycetaceae bacterium]MDG1806528.1 helix-hairpin-helix domain-containing protein [Pirellulaceae bacterium]MDG2105278.1 helix-hairpin-helix domain-containing protein [Pirellulaceae bacterium]